MKRFLLSICLAALAALPALAQFTASGTEPAKVNWQYFNSANYQLIFPEGLDSLARLYAASLERYRIPNSVTSGFKANQFYKTPMPAVLHSFTGYSNGSVSWAPRNMSLYTNPESYNPDPQNWIDQLAVHEGRHAAQMQFGASARKFEIFNILSGELFAGAMATIYSGPTFLEGDAVAAETALTDAGRGRTADFLQYYRVCFADSLWRNYWKWSYGSQRWYTPDYYRAGYVLHAGMRNTFDKPDFTKYYYQRVVRKPLFPFFNLQKSVKEVSGLKFKKAFRRIEEDFAADWAHNDTLRMELFGEFQQGEAVTRASKYFRAYRGLTMLDDTLYAIRSGLDLVPELVRINNDGTASRLSYIGSQASRLTASKKTHSLYWTDHASDLRWEKKSSSRLYRFDIKTGKARELSGPDDRWYSPVASPVDGLVAVISNRLDSRTELLLVSGWSGEVWQTLPAPDSLQLVEPAWIDDKLYASAIGPNGFGIYAVDGWTELLPQRIVKINRLFGYEGRLWFTSDRDGTAELYSLGTDGSLRQETNLRFGGNDWFFSGDNLLYTALSVNDKGVKAMPASELLGQPVSPEPLLRPIPEKLSYQEDTLAAHVVLGPKDSLNLEFPEARVYDKAANLFKFHSWLPVYVDQDVVSSMSFEDIYTESDFGATVFFQNDLETSYGQIGVEAFGGTMPALHLQWVYAEWLPKIEVRASVGGVGALSQDYALNAEATGYESVIDTLSTPRISGLTRIYVPINLSSGAWTSGLIPSFTVTASNDKLTAMNRIGNIVYKSQHPWLGLQASLRGYTMLPAPPSGIFPKLGIGVEGGFIDYPLHRVSVPGTVYLSTYGYLPGLFPTHGLRLAASISREIGGTWTLEKTQKASVEYALPFAPVDWSFMSPVTYVRNFELHLYGSYVQTAVANLIDYTTDQTLQVYVGAGVCAYLANFAWSPYPIRIGAKYLYNPIHPELSGVSAIFSTDL